ncbi:hypothetical protein ADIS_2747 [Lunatimonas lonarensis]|uniref:Uncharacterized protein n=1 Tax=Lunatimonas lonarensis TaxID=1232681 RepID=R7ZRU7_9BACT|nr:hypothetical protein ADIS_2747 [Lunatimonas lonarensis]
MPSIGLEGLYVSPTGTLNYRNPGNSSHTWQKKQERKLRFICPHEMGIPEKRKHLLDRTSLKP